MKHILILGFTILLMVFGCKNEESDKDQKPKSLATKIEDNQNFQDIEILFTDKKFTGEEERKLLLELKICSEDSELLKNSQTPPCSPEYFKFLPLRKDLSLKNGFLLLIKAETGGFPLRRLLIFQRERGELVKINGYVANLIGRIKAESGYDDLLLRFQDKDGEGKMWYNCLFTWENGQYQYKQVERIEGPNWGGPVLDKYKEETSKDVYEAIINNKMIF